MTGKKHQRSIEGIVRNNRSPVSARRPSLDPFNQSTSSSPQIGLSPSTNIGLSESTDAISGAPALGDGVPELVPEKKPKKRWFAKRADKRSSPGERRLGKRILKTAALGITILVLAGGGYLGFSVFRATKRIFHGGSVPALALQKEVDPTKLKGEGDGRVNILLTGIGGPGHDGPYLTDTLLIASLDPFAKEVALLSVPRDLWVTVKGVGSSKINAVLPNSKDRHNGSIPEGMKTLEEVLSTSLDIPIHYYALVDFTAFKDAIDTVGGVDINVTKELYDTNVAWENNNNPLIAAVGQQHMNGKKALLYARSRYGSARGDFDRTQRQREVMVALKDKVFSLGTFSNPVKMSQLINTAGSHAQTDLSIDELKRMYEIIKDVPSSKVQSLGLADPPHELVKTGNINGASVVIPIAGAGNFKDIQDYVHSSLVDGFIKKENAQIMILNASGSAGLGKTKADQLKSYGYQVGTVANADKNQLATEIIEVTKGKAPYSKKYLENRFKVAAHNGSMPEGQTGTADFVIILGSNAVSQ